MEVQTDNIILKALCTFCPDGIRQCAVSGLLPRIISGISVAWRSGAAEFKGLFQGECLNVGPKGTVGLVDEGLETH